MTRSFAPSLPPPGPGLRPVSPVRYSHLSVDRRRLVTLVHGVHFGRVEDLRVRGGQPQFVPPPRVTRTRKIAGERAPESAPPAGDAPLRREWVDLLAELDALDDGVVGRIEVAHGVPLFIEVVDAQPAV